MPEILLRSWNESYPVQTMCQARIQFPFMTEDVLLVVADLRMVLHCLFITMLIDASFCATSFFESLPKNLVSGSSPLAQIYSHFSFLTRFFTCQMQSQADFILVSLLRLLLKFCTVTD